MAFGAKIYVKRLPCSKLQTIGRSAGNELGRRRIETQLRTPRRSIEAAIDERDFARTGRQFTQLAASLALLTAHFEQIGEIIAERESQREGDRRLAMVADRDALMCDAFPEIGGANDMKRIARQNDVPFIEDIGIGEVRGQSEIVIADA